MSRWALQQKGFTVVELLIVIVVQAILAASTIVADNGIQTRVENTKSIQAISGTIFGGQSSCGTGIICTINFPALS